MKTLFRVESREFVPIAYSVLYSIAQDSLKEYNNVHKINFPKTKSDIHQMSSERFGNLILIDRTATTLLTLDKMGEHSHTHTHKRTHTCSVNLT